MKISAFVLMGVVDGLFLQWGLLRGKSIVHQCRQRRPVGTALRRSKATE